MKNSDVMFEINIQLARDGTVRMARDQPCGPISSPKVVALGMLDVAKSMVASELKPGSASEGEGHD